MADEDRQREALLALVAEDNEDGAALPASLKRDPGAVGLDSLLTEITKLNDVRQLGLPDGLFADCSQKMVAAWQARAVKMYPSDLRDTAEDARITLLAALCSSRQAEITDALVELLLALVHKINTRAERRGKVQLPGSGGPQGHVARRLPRPVSTGRPALMVGARRKQAERLPRNLRARHVRDAIRARKVAT